MQEILVDGRQLVLELAVQPFDDFFVALHVRPSGDASLIIRQAVTSRPDPGG
jgi:hypothetical protein